MGLLVAISMGFFFTLGLHYGKKISGGELTADAGHAEAKLEESPEVLPPRESLEQGAQHSGGATDETIREATQQEIADSKVKLESPKQVDLPQEKKTEASSAANEKVSDGGQTAEKPKFAIQLGSYPSKKEAQLKVRSLSKKGVESEIRTADVNGQIRYRVIIPGFAKKAQADARAREISQLHKITNFIVIKSE